MLSVFEIIKVGIGPSSSHTMGPWKAALQFIKQLQQKDLIKNIKRLKVVLYGSLAKTGKGHGSDVAALMGLQGYDYTSVDPNIIQDQVAKNRRIGVINIESYKIKFNFDQDIIFNSNTFLPYHPNAMEIIASLENNQPIKKTYYSVGGGFIIEDAGTNSICLKGQNEYNNTELSASLILRECVKNNFTKISDFTYKAELTLATQEEIQKKTEALWMEVKSSIYRGLNRKGELPGGLGVKYRSGQMATKLINGKDYGSCEELFNLIRQTKRKDFSYVNKWIACFAMSVNEENASFSRIVTSPTNGASGIMPAIIAYAYIFTDAFEKKRELEVIMRFILTAGQIGCLFKKNATISGAMGGCQAEVGVSSAMCAAALTEILGGSIQQVFQAAEIGMEHHLGLTCDPINGLVQIPCIERNSMGAIKAITASNIALEENPKQRLIELDTVVKSMMQTALDMDSKYKETSEAGLAAQFNNPQRSSC